MQRQLDILISCMALLVCSPFFFLLVILLKVTGEGEVFFFQERVGFNGRIFYLIKFVTMLKDSPNIGTRTVTVKNDARVLPLGRFLRASKINEIPQLVNVLKGDMSLIGPRPQAPQNFSFFTPEVQEDLKLSRPGLSGVGAIVFRNESELLVNKAEPLQFYQTVISPYKGELESWYVKNVSATLYFKLLIITVLTVLVSVKPHTIISYLRLPKPPHNLDF